MTNANPVRSVYYMWKFLILKTIMNLLSSLGVSSLLFSDPVLECRTEIVRSNFTAHDTKQIPIKILQPF